MEGQVHVKHIYHQGWDCVCEAKQLSSGAFKAVTCRRSLHKGNTTAQVSSTQVHQTASQAFADARAMAIRWADENKSYPQCPC